MNETNRQHEIDRLRLLLHKATGARKALMVEIEPSDRGFRIIGTGITPEHEMEAMQTIAQYMNVLLKGAIRFTVEALDATSEDRWKGGKDLAARLHTIAGSPDGMAPVPETSASASPIDSDDEADR